MAQSSLGTRCRAQGDALAGKTVRKVVDELIVKENGLEDGLAAANPP